MMASGEDSNTARSRSSERCSSASQGSMTRVYGRPPGGAVPRGAVATAAMSTSRSSSDGENPLQPTQSIRLARVDRR
jgi:hypothetical protein